MKNLSDDTAGHIARAVLTAVKREGYTILPDYEYKALMDLRLIFEDGFGKWLGLDNVAKRTPPEEIKRLWEVAKGMK